MCWKFVTVSRVCCEKSVGLKYVGKQGQQSDTESSGLIGKYLNAFFKATLF